MLILYIFSFIIFILRIFQILCFIIFLYNDLSYIIEVELIVINCLFPRLGFIVDIYSLSFSSFVCLISSSVFLFRTIYIEGDKYLVRFFILLLMFVGSIILLIFRANILTSLLGWDGLGFVSYVLVVYYPNKFSLSGGLMTIITNRLGDSFILLRVAILIVFGRWEIVETKIRLIMLILACITKRAQFPFSSWLPAAIAAPTPVSSLVHSSTLVTAGVYVLFRFTPLVFDKSSSEFLLICSILTIFLAGICASFEYDLKKIIALSTLSQLGVIIFSISIGLKFLAFFHLIVHAFFKALIFLSGGSLMHGYSGRQDIRFIGSISYINPYVNSCLIFSSLCLGAFPFLSSFYSKHLILDSFLFENYNIFLLLILYISNILTLFYRVRLIGFLRGRFLNFRRVIKERENYNIFLSLSRLVLLSLLGSYLLFSYYFIIPDFIRNTYYEKLIINIIFPISVILTMIILKFVFTFLKLENNFKDWYFGGMWFISYFSGQCIMRLIKFLSNNYIVNLEYGLREFYGPQGLGIFFSNIGTFISLKQFKLIEFYHLNFLFWIIFIPLICFYSLID